MLWCIYVAAVRKIRFAVAQFEKKIEKSKKRDRMDLKELLPKFDYDFLGDQDANPSYCTQTIVGKQEPVHGILQVPKQ